MTRYTRSQILATPSDKIVDLINVSGGWERAGVCVTDN